MHNASNLSEYTSITCNCKHIEKYMVTVRYVTNKKKASNDKNCCSLEVCWPWQLKPIKFPKMQVQTWASQLRQ